MSGGNDFEKSIVSMLSKQNVNSASVSAEILDLRPYGHFTIIQNLIYAIIETIIPQIFDLE